MIYPHGKLSQIAFVRRFRYFSPTRTKEIDVSTGATMQRVCENTCAGAQSSRSFPAAQLASARSATMHGVANAAISSKTPSAA